MFSRNRPSRRELLSSGNIQVKNEWSPFRDTKQGSLGVRTWPRIIFRIFGLTSVYDSTAHSFRMGTICPPRPPARTPKLPVTFAEGKGQAG